MAKEILYGLSVNELDKEIKKLVLEDQRSLPNRAKVFAAVVKMQRFDVLPELVDHATLNAEVYKGIELNRGMSSTKGVPSMFYARELVRGAMYPGTLTALGHGIYFAVPSMKHDESPNFSNLISHVALKYTKCEQPGDSGVLMRAVLKNGSKIANCDDLKEDLKGAHRNRAKSCGITDIGTFAAALGYDAYFADGIYQDSDERIYTVLNRGAILVQNTVKLVKN